MEFQILQNMFYQSRKTAFFSWKLTGYFNLIYSSTVYKNPTFSTERLIEYLADLYSLKEPAITPIFIGFSYDPKLKVVAYFDKDSKPMIDVFLWEDGHRFRVLSMPWADGVIIRVVNEHFPSVFGSDLSEKGHDELLKITWQDIKLMVKK